MQFLCLANGHGIASVANHPIAVGIFQIADKTLIKRFGRGRFRCIKFGENLRHSGVIEGIRITTWLQTKNGTAAIGNRSVTHCSSFHCFFDFKFSIKPENTKKRDRLVAV